MRVVVAPDSAGGTLDPAEMAAAIAAGWRRGRPGDHVVELPLSDGGEGLLTALGASTFAAADRRRTEVVDARGLARDVTWLLRDDGCAVIESARACGLALVPEDRRDPLDTTTWGVGQLLDAARRAGAHRVLVGLGGSATVDGGTGALAALGLRLTVADGSGLKVGGRDLRRVAGAARTWVGDWRGVEVVLLADVTDTLLEAPAAYGPQKGADRAAVAELEAGLRAWRSVAEQDLGADPTLADAPHTGAAGGLGYGIAVGIGARFVPGAAIVAELVDLAGALARADVVVTGEGRLDATSGRGKVVSHVAAAGAAHDVPVALVVGAVAPDVEPTAVVDAVAVAEASPAGIGDDPAADVSAAAAALASGWS